MPDILADIVIPGGIVVLVLLILLIIWFARRA
jgi:hypothetical protein